MESESAFVKQDSLNLPLDVLLEFLVDPTKLELKMEDAAVSPASKTTMEFVLNVPPELSGAQPQANASSFVDKTQLTMIELENASVLKDLVLLEECVRNALPTILSAMDTVLLAQSTPNIVKNQETAIVLVDSLPISLEFVVKNVEPMKNTILILINVNASRVLAEFKEDVPFALLVLRPQLMEEAVQTVVLMRSL